LIQHNGSFVVLAKLREVSVGKVKERKPILLKVSHQIVAFD